MTNISTIYSVSTCPEFLGSTQHIKEFATIYFIFYFKNMLKTECHSFTYIADKQKI